MVISKRVVVDVAAGKFAGGVGDIDSLVSFEDHQHFILFSWLP